ncbi:MAG: hypothetical protein C0506_10130 [Anaerolinea sp.]|nr:hypothetical protein [Anaerolinea sp.]
MSQVSELQTLQELDDQAAALRAALDDVERKLRGDEELDAARRLFAVTETAVSPLRKDGARLDGQVKALTAKIEQEEKKLYSGTVTSPKELQNIQHEVDSLKEQRARVGDQLLDVELKLDVANREYESAAASVKALEEARAKSVDGWRHEVNTLHDGITRVDARRESQKTKIPPRALAVYERVRERRGGNALAKIQGSTCSACRVSMPDSVRKQAFHPDVLVQCPNCERILYLG